MKEKGKNKNKERAAISPEKAGNRGLFKKDEAATGGVNTGTKPDIDSQLNGADTGRENEENFSGDNKEDISDKK